MIQRRAKISPKLRTLVNFCESLERVGPFGGGSREGHTEMKKTTMSKWGGAMVWHREWDFALGADLLP